MAARSRVGASIKVLQNRLRGSRNPWALLGEIKASLPRSQLGAFVPLARTCRHNGRPIVAPVKQDARTLCTAILPAPVAWEKELAWTCELILENKLIINQFWRMARLLEESLLSNNVNECLNILDKIESTTGISLWSIENRIALLQQAGGLEAQKEYSTSIKCHRRERDPIGFIVHKLSYRAEMSVTAFRFTYSFNELMDSSEIDEGLSEYLKFRLASTFPESKEGLSRIIHIEQISPIVDLYDTFIDICQHALAHGMHDIEGDIAREMSRLYHFIDDPRVSAILFALGVTDELSLEPMGDLILSSCYGNEADVLGKTIMDCLSSYPDNISMYYHKAMLCVKSGQNDDETLGISGEIVRILRDITLRNESFGGSVSDAFKLMLVYRTHNWSSSLYTHVMRNLTSAPFAAKEHGLNAFLDGRYLDPKYCLFLGDRGQAYLKICESVYSDGAVIRFFGERLAARTKQVCAPRSNVFSGYWKMVVDIEGAIGREEYGEARILARPYESSDDDRHRWWADRAVCHCLLKEGRYDDLLEKIVTVSLGNPHAIHLLPIDEAVKKAADIFIKNNLNLAIALHMYIGLSDDKDSHHLLRYAFEDFLADVGVDLPSELKQCRVDDPDKLIYFLKHIATQENMDLLPSFSSSYEVDEERIEICSWLVMLDPSSRESYQQEIKEITTSLVVHAGVRLIDRSRIYVDSMGLKRWAEKGIKEDFSRYIAFLKAGVGFSDDGFAGALIEHLSGKPLPDEFLTVPKGEAQAVLADLVRSLLSQFLHNPEHGLDSYLSLRIRHGTLAGQLRAALEEERIITQKDGISRQYKPNQLDTSKNPGDLGGRLIH